MTHAQKFGEDRTCSGDTLADKQTDKRTNRQLIATHDKYQLSLTDPRDNIVL